MLDWVLMLVALPAIGEPVSATLERRLLWGCRVRRDVEICADLSTLYDPWYAHPEVADAHRALRILRLACEQGHAQSCAQQALFLDPRYPHPGVEDDEIYASVLHERACAAGVAVSCTRLGDRYSLEMPWSQLGGAGASLLDLSRARDWWEQGCALGDRRGCESLADLYSPTVRGGLGLIEADAVQESRFKARAASLVPADCGEEVDGTTPRCTTVAQRQRAASAGDLFGIYSVWSAEAIRQTVQSQEGGLGEIDEARQHLERACEVGNPAGCRGLGSLYDGRFTPWLVEEDPGRALEAYEKACRLGAPMACVDLGRMQDPRQAESALKVDIPAAAAAYEAGCESGLSLSCGARATLAYGSQVHRRTFLEKGCALGSRQSCTLIGSLVETSGADGGAPDPVAASVYFAQGCAQGEPAACLRLGMLHDTGLGRSEMAQDNSEAARHYGRACELDYAEGCAALGTLHDSWHDHPGVAPDDARARDIYEKACDMGSAMACSNLGWLFDTGFIREGFEQDNATAGLYYERACEMGDATGCAHLAMLFDSLFARPGAEKDDLQAYQYYERACALGSAKGCFGQDGFNQPGFDSLDIVGHNVQALAYFTEGCELGYPEDCYNLGALYLGAWKHPGLSYDRAKAREAWQRACALGVDQACE